MKAFHSVLKRTGLMLLCPLLFLYLRGRKRIAIGAILSLAMFILGCFQHYYTKSIGYSADPAMIERLRVRDKIFIAHFQDSMVQLHNLRADKDQILAEARMIDQEMRKQVQPENLRKRTYKPSTQGTVPTQVHFYMKEPIADFHTNDSGTCRIRYSQIRQIDIHEKDDASTKTSKTFSIVGLVIGGALVAMILLFLLSCNCPQVYVDETDGYTFRGGMYSGAVMSTAERTDYMVLDNFPVHRPKARIRIDNVYGETQLINQLRLIRVQHPHGSKVLADRHGRMFSFMNPVTPVAAWSGSGKNIVVDLQSADGRMAFFDERNENRASAIFLRFPKTMSGKKARLILHGLNTGWAGYLNHQLQGYFGGYYTAWRTQQEKKDPKAMEAWMLKQSLPIKVYTRQPNGNWRMADYVPLAGNTAMRKYILELDLPSASISSIDIKLETVYNFWQIDYAALDTSEQSDIQTEWIAPNITRSVHASTHADKLAKIDHQYVVLQGNESLNLEFMLPADKTGQQTFFLAGTGYYHQPPAAEGRPDIGKLISFRKPGAFHSFSISETRKMETGMVVHQETRLRDR